MGESTESRQHIRRLLLTEIDIPYAATDFAIEGMMDTADLWWLYEAHRIMSDS